MSGPSADVVRKEACRYVLDVGDHVGDVVEEEDEEEGAEDTALWDACLDLLLRGGAIA